jgi:glyoxylase-like metal-dependent hydrolase (beta-lactamase superfamily II)
MMKLDVLVQGFPGKSVCHGGLGWSTVTLLRHEDRIVLIDVGAFGMRREIAKQLKAQGVAPGDVTDVVLTHAHYDHSVNFTLFPNATAWIGADELAWAAAQPPGFNPLPELYVRELATSARVRRVVSGETLIPGLTAIAGPGHTPGHLLFLLEIEGQRILFTGDAAKNRAELLAMAADSTMDASASKSTFERIWALWRSVPGTLLVPGHDLTMRIDDEGRPAYVGERKAGIEAWFGESLEEVSTIDLCCPPTGLVRST